LAPKRPQWETATGHTYCEQLPAARTVEMVAQPSLSPIALVAAPM
jgi:hypothetical protein